MKITSRADGSSPATFIASSEEDDPTGSFQYYNDLNCTEREYAFSGVYIETITTGRETCNNDANGEVSMLIKEANEKKPTALHKTISVVVYPDRNCPFNVVASESLVPSDGSCGPWTGKQSSKFIRESSDSTVGDIVVYKDDDCAIVDEYLSANLEEIDAGLDQGPSCRNSDRVDSYGISFP
ncbi:hypothetical protein SARC_02106 [Sphaeroforma arctica JP610]|uniref:Uncharacterized protein n=1 Tax=Sphaeroforma arctica JP610 TaxID=667725 RepID=A0A0L0G9M6_9EUKA|nr:hypothetical protein SARC_02106 [Sphaeroforma arctica JP610]KNC85732.1 hypothetical protein SARC_02106 [Sphaeroforma arctica JP610]|eukprot:XP_014159634.1 hypothetical protein SARC_02106 [Sphaeroforma arctica JP610]